MTEEATRNVRLRTPLLEREREESTLEAAIAAAADGDGMTLLIQGPAGIGKSALLDRCLALAGAGMKPLKASEGELERDLPWSIAPAVLGRARWCRDDRALSGAAQFAGRLLAPTRPMALPDGPEAMASAFHALYWLTSNLADQAPLVIVVDDCHWVDDPSLRFLTFLAHRVGDLPVLLCLAVRQGGFGAAVDLLGELAHQAVVVRPRPLSEEAAFELIRRELDEQPEPGFARACHDVTAGSPFLLTELCAGLRGEGVAPNDDAADRLVDVTPEAIRGLRGLSVSAGRPSDEPPVFALKHFALSLPPCDMSGRLERRARHARWGRAGARGLRDGTAPLREDRHCATWRSGARLI